MRQAHVVLKSAPSKWLLTSSDQLAVPIHNVGLPKTPCKHGDANLRRSAGSAPVTF
jgi:hypothetical protein